MNIALLIDDLTIGGAEAVVQRLAIGLVQRGHRACVYCLTDAGPPGLALADAGVTVRAAHSTGRDPTLAWRLARWLHQDRIDVAHAHSSSAVVWTLPAAITLRRPLVQTRHGALLGKPSGYRRLAQHLAPLLAHTIIVAESLRPQLPPGRIARTATWIPNGIDRPRLPEDDARHALESLCGRPLPGPIVLCVGTICPEKDTVGLLRAFDQLHHQHPQATLICVGPARGTDYANEVHALRSRLGLEQHVLLPGPADDAWRLLAAADVFCLSSSTEAMPLAVVEAMSQHVPIVATAVGDVGTLAPAHHEHKLLHDRRTALLVPPHQPPALAVALAEVLSNPAAAHQRAAHAAADYERRYTGDQMVRRHEQIYEQVGRSHARRPQSHHATSHEPHRPQVLMIGPDPHQLGGMNSVIDSLLASPLNTHCDLHRFGLPPTRPAPHAGKSSRLARVLAPLHAIARHARSMIALAGTIVSRRIDVVHIHTCSYFTFYRNAFDLLIARGLRRRVCLHIHGGRFAEFCTRSTPGRQRLIRRVCEAADTVFVLSHQARRRLGPHLGRSRLTVIPNGINLPPASPRPSTERTRPPRFVFLGALTRNKGLLELIEAAAQLRDAEVPFELIIAGPHVASEPLDWGAHVRGRRLQNHISFVGPVHGDAKAKLLAEADCLVLPSHEEAFPIVILEAAAAGLAVIATAVGGVPEILARRPGRPTGRFERAIAPLVPPRDPHALAMQMSRLAGDARLRRLARSALRLRVASEYTLTHVADRVTRAYTEILRRQPRHHLHDALAWFCRHVTYPLHERLRGRDTIHELRALHELAERQPEDVERIVTRRLRALLIFASRHLPHYRDLMARHDVNPRADDPRAELRKLPVMTKDDVRHAGGRLVWPDVPGGLHACSSGGTTGDTLYFHIDTLRQSQDRAARLFMQGLFGAQPGERRVHLWGSPIEAAGSRIRRWRDRLLNELLLDAFDMSPERMRSHLRQIRRFRPSVIYGYTTALTRLAEYAATRYGPDDFPWLKLAVLTGEEVTAAHRAQVHTTFGCPVAAEYGNREVGLIAHDCPAGRLHLVASHAHVDVVSNGELRPAGDCGELICTNLNTRAQPFLRYRVGDLGRFATEPCPCCLPFPVLRVEGGKIAGFIALPGGRLCHGAVSSHALIHIPGIVAFRTHQRRLDWIEILLVTNDDFRPQSITEIQQRYHRLFGSRITVDCHIVDHIPPDPSGKRRHVISDVAPDYTRFDVVTVPHTHWLNQH